MSIFNLTFRNSAKRKVQNSKLKCKVQSVFSREFCVRALRFTLKLCALRFELCAACRCIILFLVVTTSSGCSEQLALLRSYSQEQDEQQAYMQAQQIGFEQLQQDVVRNVLQAGIARQDCLFRYGDPIACVLLKDVSQPEIAEECVYAAPQQFIHRRVIRLYFDAQQKLLSWKLSDEQV